MWARACEDNIMENKTEKLRVKIGTFWRNSHFKGSGKSSVKKKECDQTFVLGESMTAEAPLVRREVWRLVTGNPQRLGGES